jgi:formiminotetrahydrofolate cyclodeaminase
MFPGDDWQQLPLARFVEQVATPTAAPAGGSIAAVVIALAAALVEMAAGLSLGWEHASAVAERARELRERALPLAQRDAEVYARVLAARGEARRAALAAAAEPPLALAKLGREVVELAAQVRAQGNPSLAGDADTAAVLAAAASQAATALAEINLTTDREE